MSFTTQTPLEDDSLPGTTAPTIKKLRDAGITTLEALVVTPPRTIVDITSMKLETAQKAITKARSLIDPGFITAKERLEQLKNSPRCTTGSEKLDGILGGGIETGAITEFYGEYGSGKTQTLMTIAVMAQQSLEEGGLDGRVAVIDCENSFKTLRVQQIAEERGYDSDEILNNILIAEAYNSPHLLTLIQGLHRLVQDNNVKVVIVDSIISHFRSEYDGRANLAPRQQLLAKCLGTLLRIVIANDVAVVFANQAQADPSGYISVIKATGGHVMAHAPHYRVRLMRGRKNTRLAKVMDSSYLPEDQVRIAITERGIEDVTE